MFKKEDIVAVFGESLSEGTLKISHHPINDPDTQAMAVNATFEACAVPEICIVRFTAQVGREQLLVVKKAKDGEKAMPIVVSSRQCRLIQRDGREVESKKAKYYLFDDGEFYGAYGTLEACRSAAENRQNDAYDSDESWEDNSNLEILKGILIHG